MKDCNPCRARTDWLRFPRPAFTGGDEDGILYPEQVAKAKEWDLLTCLQVFEPGELKKCGTNEYCTRTHDSLKISNGKWNWHSRGIGGRTALEYLIKIRGLTF